MLSDNTHTHVRTHGWAVQAKEKLSQREILKFRKKGIRMERINVWMDINIDCTEQWW